MLPFVWPETRNLLQISFIYFSNVFTTRFDVILYCCDRIAPSLASSAAHTLVVLIFATICKNFPARNTWTMLPEFCTKHYILSWCNCKFFWRASKVQMSAMFYVIGKNLPNMELRMYTNWRLRIIHVGTTRELLITRYIMLIADLHP